MTDAPRPRPTAPPPGATAASSTLTHEEQTRLPSLYDVDGQTQDELSRRFCIGSAARYGGESETLYAPAMVDEPAVRAALLDNDTVRQALDKARRADMALVGIGDMSEDSNMVRMGWFSASEITEAKRAGTVGDMMGYDFIDIHGRPSAAGMQGRVVGLNANDLKRIPNVIAIAAESSKVTAMLGALRTGTINTLATTASNAMAVLHLDDATRGAAEGNPGPAEG